MVDKTCSKCEKSKDESLFRKGRNSCKECEKIADRELYNRKKELGKEKKSCIQCKEEKTTADFNLNSDVCKVCKKQHKIKLDKLLKKCDKNTHNVCIHCLNEKQLSFFVIGRNICSDCNNDQRRNKLAKERVIDRTYDKTCTKCNKTMNAENFNVGIAWCKACANEQKKIRLSNYKQTENNTEKKTCIKCNIDQESKNFRLGENVCYECSKLMLYKWRDENPDKCEAINKKYRSKEGYRTTQNISKKKRYNEDPQENYRQNYRRYLRDYVFNNKIKKNFDKICDCDRDKFRDWIEYNFTQGMNWENYGKEWNLDHVKPCSSFVLTDENKLKECFNWKNTVPVYLKDNLTKFNKIDDKLVKLYEIKVELFEDKRTQREIKLYKIKKAKVIVK